MTSRKLGCANPVGICELRPEVCLIVVGSEQRPSGTPGGQSLKKKKQKPPITLRAIFHSLLTILSN